MEYSSAISGKKDIRTSDMNCLALPMPAVHLSLGFDFSCLRADVCTFVHMCLLCVHVCMCLVIEV